MKVVERGVAAQAKVGWWNGVEVKCDAAGGCGSTIRLEPTDPPPAKDPIKMYSYYICCPLCKEEITVRRPEKNLSDPTKG
ncbi:MAG: hypothetical protein G01um101419_259 [Parcubacteria group bacterium Gr01-1014_19]|nr:MAG: hypothetical protein G01um101419_259 [Parcubacteria group bacterium Gr01-1014_19]